MNCTLKAAEEKHQLQLVGHKQTNRTEGLAIPYVVVYLIQIRS